MAAGTDVKRVLVVDDDPAIRELFITFAGQNTDLLSLKTAATAYEAGSQITNFNPDILFLDIALGKIDGRKLCKITRDHHKQHPLRIIAISGNIQNESELKGSGFDYFLKKPFDMDTVKTLILD